MSEDVKVFDTRNSEHHTMVERTLGLLQEISGNDVGLALAILKVTAKVLQDRYGAFADLGEGTQVPDLPIGNGGTA